MKDIHNLFHQILSEGGTPGTLFLLLSELKQAGDPGAVIQGCTEALSFFPGDIRIRHLMAEACLETGCLTLGESEIEKATEEIDRLIPAYRLKAEIYLRSKRPDDARKALEIYLAHRPDDLEAVRFLEPLRPAPEPQVAAPLLEPAEEPEPLSLPDIATPTLAEVYFGQGQIQEAIATYEKFLAQNPQAERFRQRLEEIQAMVSQAPAAEIEMKPDPTRVKKERVIAVLEDWRSRLREATEAAVPR